MPRLLRRREAAAYLGLSAAQFDNIRIRGDINNVPVPSDRALAGVCRIPLFDIRDLDAAIDRWKAAHV